MTAIAYKSSVRKYQKTAPINSAANDYSTDAGIRISVPLYIDIPNTERKLLLNAVRLVAHEQLVTETATAGVSGITVQQSNSRQAEVESYLGMTLDILRSVLFQRGGLALDLVLKLQAITEFEYVSEKDLAAAFKNKQTFIKNWIKTTPFGDV